MTDDPRPLTLMEKAQTPTGLFLSFAHNAWHTALDWLYPPRCAGCGRLDTAWCNGCATTVAAIPPLHWLEAPPPLTHAVATAPHDGLLRDAIHALKYENTPALARPLADRLATALSLLEWPVDVIVPVPTTGQRIRERGYNQAARIAEPLHHLTHIAYAPNALTRTRETRSQVGEGREVRLANLRDALTSTTSLEGQQVLLIDDVFTTGATACACAGALLQSGASAVYALTVTASPLSIR